MVTQDQVKTALYELGKRATVKEITDHLYLKKQIQFSYDEFADSRVNRVLNVLRNWGEVDRIISTYDKNKMAKRVEFDVWFIVDQMK